MTTKLHHCHNCGSTGIKIGGITVFDTVMCGSCGFEGLGAWDNIYLAIDLWNLKGVFSAGEYEKQRKVEANKKQVAELVQKFRTKTYKPEAVQILERIDKVNQFIEAIANCGRKFFRFEDRVAWIERSSKGKLFLHNEWNEKRIYISKYGPWKHFHHGGTLHGLIGMLVEFIKTGKKLCYGHFGEYWGYDHDISKVIAAGQELGVLEDMSPVPAPAF